MRKILFIFLTGALLVSSSVLFAETPFSGSNVTIANASQSQSSVATTPAELTQNQKQLQSTFNDFVAALIDFRKLELKLCNIGIALGLADALNGLTIDVEHGKSYGGGGFGYDPDSVNKNPFYVIAAIKLDKKFRTFERAFSACTSADFEKIADLKKAFAPVKSGYTGYYIAAGGGFFSRPGSLSSHISFNSLKKAIDAFKAELEADLPKTADTK
ncbi:MAG: hypothetical protein HQM08_06030 [Candidatus Riflebacteria bacterium]|nr:hypothetical protein [Candidatus Riflebacteria bacterium]